jgi:hypothetical protein
VDSQDGRGPLSLAVPIFTMLEGSIPLSPTTAMAIGFLIVLFAAVTAYIYEAIEAMKQLERDWKD